MKRFLFMAKNGILEEKESRAPFIIALAGSVAVGKSTTARVFKLMLDRWFSKTRQVELVTTDGFLYPNKVLEERGIMDKKASLKATTATVLLSF